MAANGRCRYTKDFMVWGEQKCAAIIDRTNLGRGCGRAKTQGAAGAAQNWAIARAGSIGFTAMMMAAFCVRSVSWIATARQHAPLGLAPPGGVACPERPVLLTFASKSNGGGRISSNLALGWCVAPIDRATPGRDLREIPGSPVRGSGLSPGWARRYSEGINAMNAASSVHCRDGKGVIVLPCELRVVSKHLRAMPLSTPGRLRSGFGGGSWQDLQAANHRRGIRGGLPGTTPRLVIHLGNVLDFFPTRAARFRHLFFRGHLANFLCFPLLGSELGVPQARKMSRPSIQTNLGAHACCFFDGAESITVTHGPPSTHAAAHAVWPG